MFKNLNNFTLLSIFIVLFVGLQVEAAPLSGGNSRNETVDALLTSDKNETLSELLEIEKMFETVDRILGIEEKNETDATTRFNSLLAKITPEQKKVIAHFFVDFEALFGDRHLEEKTIRMYAELNKKHPDVYPILRLGFNGVQEGFKASKEAKDFLSFYYNRIDSMKSGQDDEFQKFLTDIQAEWKKLNKSAQDEMEKEFKATVQLINGE